MRILYYFKEKDRMMDKWQRYHIFNELERHNCYITVYNPLEYSTVEEANDRLIEFIDKYPFDLFMTPHGNETLFIESLLEIKRKGIPTLLICFDNLIVPFNHHKIAPYFDLVWLTSKETERLFVSWGANVIFNPYAANPHYFKPRYDKEIDRVAFIGTPYGSRVNMLNLMTENEVNVNLHANISSPNNQVAQSKPHKMMEYIQPVYNLIRFGIGRRVLLGALKQKFLGTHKLDIHTNFLEMKPPVGLDKLSELYSNYALSLASTTARNTGVLRHPVHIVNLRSFEIPMSGGLQICSYFEELAKYFEEDKEIIFYRSNDEFIEKLRFYLRTENENIRMKMKLAARKRAESEHTWLHRFKKVFDYFGLPYTGNER